MGPLGKLHEKLERYCSRKVGVYMTARQRGENPTWDNGWRFKIASRLEFRLRRWLYTSRHWDDWSSKIRRLPKYEDYNGKG